MIFNIAALCEIRLSGEGRLTVSCVSYAYFCKGHPKDEKNEWDVSLAIHTELTKHLEQLQGISDRIIFLSVPLSCDCYMTVFSVYDRTLNGPEESIMAFYQDLRTAIAKVPKADEILLLSDFHARVCKVCNTWKALKKHGLGEKEY